MIRLWLYRLLALAALLWMVLGWWSTSQYNAAHPVSTPGGQVGQALGSGAFLAIVFCTGIPLFLLFSLLAWRMQVYRRNTKRHQDTMRALDKTRPHGE